MHAARATIRTVLLETLPLRSAAEEQNRTTALVVFGSESGGIKGTGFNRINVTQTALE
jgi:hypothetical protein